MRVLASLVVVGFSLVCGSGSGQAEDVGLSSGAGLNHADMARDVGMSGVDQRVVVCDVTPKLLHTVWMERFHPHVCTGGANRLGAGYVRYLETSRVKHSKGMLRG